MGAGDPHDLERNKRIKIMDGWKFTPKTKLIKQTTKKTTCSALQSRFGGFFREMNIIFDKFWKTNTRRT